MIKEIVMKNVKGTTANEKLTGKDIIIGSNGVGKSTRLEALGTALLGYVPGQKKTAQDTFKLSSDSNEMVVGLVTDNFSFERKFERKERTKRSTGQTEISFSESVQISPSKGERTNTQKKARIETEVGNFPIMMDFNEFLNLSDNQRRDFIYSLSNQSSDWDRTKLYQYLEDTLLETEIEITNPDYYDELRTTIDEVMKQFPESFEFEDGLNAATVWVEEQLKYWNKRKEESKGAVRQFAELKNRSTETDRNYRENVEELERLRNRLMEIKEQLARDTEKKKAFDKRQQRISELQAVIEQKIDTTQVEQLEKEISDLTNQLKEVPESRAAEYEDKAQEFERLYEQFKNSEFKDQHEKNILEAQRESIKQNIKTIQEYKGVCVIHHQIACNKDFSAYLNHAIEQIEELTVLIEQLEKSINEKVSKREGYVAEVRKYRKLAQDDNNNFRQVVNHNQQLERQIQSKKEQLASMNKVIEQKKQNIAHAKEELERLKSEPVEAIAPLNILEQQRDQIANLIKELEVKIQEQEKIKNQLATMKQTMLEAKKAELKADALTAIKRQLGPNGVRGEIVKSLLAPIKADIEANLAAMGIQYKVFFQTESDKGQDVFQFGWIQNGQARNFDALSTGQKLMFLISFMVTILDRKNPPLKVLAIDNIENLDRNNFTNVLNGLNHIADKLDNIILAGVVDEVNVEGWNVINLSKDKEGELHEIA